MKNWIKPKAFRAFIKKEKEKKIQVRLIRTVMLLVIISFIVVAAGSSIFFYNNYEAQIIRGEEEKLKLTAQQIRYIQNSVENMARQISVDSRIQDYLEEDENLSLFQVLVQEDNIRSILKTYATMSPYLVSISIYNGEEHFTTNLTYGEVNLEEEMWYKDYKTHSAKSGYTLQHMNIIENGLKSKEVISYILSVRKVGRGRQVLGDIIMDLDYSYMIKKFNIDKSMVAGFSIFDEWGNTVYTEGDMALSYQEIPKKGRRHTLDNDNVILVNDTMESGWILVTEISKRAIFKKISFVIYYSVFVCIFVGVILNLVMRKRIRSITNPIKHLHDAATEIGKGNFNVHLQITTGDELEELGNTLNKMTQDLKILMDETVEYERITKEMEINRLMLQINPHFIYNTLNSIVYMAQMDRNPRIVQFANAFIGLLQSTLTVNHNSFFVSLGQELQNVKNYLILQEYRYPDKFTYEIICAEELLDSAVPNVFIQPIVENAIFHGLSPKLGKGHLKILVEREGTDLIVGIEDNGVGMTKENMRRLMEDRVSITGQMRTIGLGNVRQRIKHIFGEKYGMEIWSQEGQGTKVTLRIAYQKYELSGGEENE